ncbi:MAG: hypothetical protein DI626_01860 [Micavibrio aeruginosavorus]|uniref:LPS-assembly lipoprotein n=1 Tax=Micavibrio aeruginosavorus TaxID=349221 RepID=A0A2W5A1B7_9BACT|nr:MAG: hypothetical protein DI626_01860 [Micavibrio aeruginosavorus]
MSSLRNVIALAAIVAALSLTACGFSPMYGSAAGSQGVSAVEGLDKVDIAMIPDEEGVFLRNILIDHFYRGGYPSSPAYTLQVQKIRMTEADLDITRESESTRRQIRLRTVMSLRNNTTGETVLTRNITAVTSYNVLGSQFTTRVSERDAREAALSDMARQIENQVVLYFKQ